MGGDRNSQHQTEVQLLSIVVVGQAWGSPTAGLPPPTTPRASLALPIPAATNKHGASSETESY